MEGIEGTTAEINDDCEHRSETAKSSKTDMVNIMKLKLQNLKVSMVTFTKQTLLTLLHLRMGRN